MLELAADTVNVPQERRSALLGRFQHLQRLKLIEGINPGRGKAAEYRAHQILIILIALQMLQLGMTPERAVDLIHRHDADIRKAITLAVASKDSTIATSLMWFDPAILSPQLDGVEDPAATTFGYAGMDSGLYVLMDFFLFNRVDRAAFIGVSGTLWRAVRSLDGRDLLSDDEVIGERGRSFLASLRAWSEIAELEGLDDGINPQT